MTPSRILETQFPKEHLVILSRRIKMTSEKQNHANSQNALLSTGPVTPQGKAVVSKNAVKHGIFTSDLVISAGDGQENATQYQDLLADLTKDLAPVGGMEILLVEKIAVNYWRLRRLLRYETGEIREGLDDFRERALHSHYGNAYNNRQKPELRYFSYNDEITDIEYQEQLYYVAAMQSSGFKPTENKISLEYVLCYRMDREEAEFFDEDYEAAKKYINALSPQMQGKLRREMLDEAEQLLVEMEEVRSWRIRFDRIEKAKSLPGEHYLNNIIKYESALERSIFRNLAVLKNLQDTRCRGASQEEEDLNVLEG
jgi:hypothetical protein